MLENPSIQLVLVHVTPICKGFYDVRSDNPSGADNQQGSPSLPTSGGDVTPQRLHAELLAVGAEGLSVFAFSDAPAETNQDEDIVHAP